MSEGPRLRVLVVEDEMTIALMMEDMLLELGHEVAGIAMRLPQAKALAGQAAFDVAFLDVNLDGYASYPVADILRARGIPFIFVTGYGLAGIDPPYHVHRVVKKPFEIKDLQDAIAGVRAAA